MLRNKFYNGSWFSSVSCILFLCLPAAQAAPIQKEMPVPIQSNWAEAPTHPRFVANNEILEVVLQGIAGEIPRMVVMSSKAKNSRRVSGEFDLKDPMAAIAYLGKQNNLIWYNDGATLYVYSGSEITTATILLSERMVAPLTDFLKRSGRFDERYPLQQIGQANAYYISAPPRYIETIQMASRFFVDQGRTLVPSATQIDIVKIKYGFVIDRTFNYRGGEVTVPGIATVLGQLLQGNQSGLRATSSNQADIPNKNNDSQTNTNYGALFNRENNADQNSSINNELVSLTNQKPIGLGERDNFSDGLQVVAHPSSNSLFLKGTRPQIELAKELINRIDIPKGQVELSLWVIDVNENDFNQLGGEFGGKVKFGKTSLGFNAAAFERGSQLTQVQTENFMMSISALVGKNEARIVSRPILLVQDNNPALFDTSQTYYIKIDGSRDRAGALEKFSAGTMIRVIPRIVDEENRVEMVLHIQDGKAKGGEGEKGGISLPVVSNTQIETIARVQEQQSLLVGGYVVNQSEAGSNKVPFLGDLPIVGNLFKFDKGLKSQYVRLFLVQPRVLPADHHYSPDDSYLATPFINESVDAIYNEMKYE